MSCSQLVREKKMQLYAELIEIILNELMYESRCEAFRKCSYGEHNRY